MLGAGRSPHVRYDPSEIDVTFDDVVGLGPVKDEVVKTLNLFLALPDVPRAHGRQPAQGDPVRRSARHRQDLHGEGDGAAKPACRTSSCRRPRSSRCTTARPAARSATTSRRCARPRAKRAARSASSRRSTRSPAPAAACAATPLPTGSTPTAWRSQSSAASSEGISGVVNELLIQLQSFDAPTVGQRIRGWCIDGLNRWLPAHRQIRKQPPPASNILVIGATNRAADLDPALLRPGRFDRSIHFDLPEPLGPARDHRLLPRPEGARPRARQGRAPRRARGDDVRLLAGDDRAPLRRGARLGAARRPRRDGLARRPAGEDDRGDRSEAAGRVHRGREAHDRDARGRSRGRRATSSARPQARGAVDHQAPRRARPARALRQRGALHAHPFRADRHRSRSRSAA